MGIKGKMPPRVYDMRMFNRLADRMKNFPGCTPVLLGGNNETLVLTLRRIEPLLYRRGLLVFTEKGAQRLSARVICSNGSALDILLVNEARDLPPRGMEELAIRWSSLEALQLKDDRLMEALTRAKESARLYFGEERTGALPVAQDDLLEWL